jgi:predicted RNA-binding Zn-ribbon protein involved in translation (DUF1610 family)
MAEEPKVKVGTKVDPAEAKKIDPARIGEATVGSSAETEVEGQATGAGYVTCPWCGTLLRGYFSDTYYLSYRCTACGGYFTAALQ